jgi:hypothetical protein
VQREETLLSRKERGEKTFSYVLINECFKDKEGRLLEESAQLGTALHFGFSLVLKVCKLKDEKTSGVLLPGDLHQLFICLLYVLVK